MPRGASLFASDANVSYRRSTLFSIREIWEESFREVVVNGALRSRGGEIVLQPDIVVYQHRTDLRVLSALTERFIWGRSYAGTRNAHLSFPNRLLHAFTTPALPLVLLARTGSTAWERRRCFRAFLRSLPLIALLQSSWSAGEGVGYLLGVASGR